MSLHNPKSKPSKLKVVLPEDPRPARTHRGMTPSTGVAGRGSQISPLSEGVAGNEIPRGTQGVSKPTARPGRVKAVGPAEHVV